MVVEAVFEILLEQQSSICIDVELKLRFSNPNTDSLYSDYMKSFKETMVDLLDAELYTDIEVGLGPAGELRYPSYPQNQGWAFPGIGEFQCYDKYLKVAFEEAAKNAGHPKWEFPDDAGEYNDKPDATGFFGSKGYLTEKGKFFLKWYSNKFLIHGDQIMDEANKAFLGCKVKLACKVYFMDTQIWYSVFCAIFGGLYGILHHLGEHINHGYGH